MRSFRFSRAAPPRWRTFGRTVAVVTTVVLLACQAKSPEQELLKKVEPVGSWLATLEMAGQKWSANSVPASFVKSTTSAARKELDTASEEAAKSRARPELRNPLRQILAEAKAANAGLRQAVEANDRSRLAREIGRLGGLRARFEAWQKAGEGGA
ncbi:MAG TPA: hypothetical protein VKM72_14470 [Thermoanaerobaculia bacterium]|nr:hypothetical protein [Thermoanaerobaculia bacterium]